MVNTPNWSRANISSKGSAKPSEIALIVRRVSASLDSPPLVSHPPLYPGNKQLENFFYPLPKAKKGRERRDGDFFYSPGETGICLDLAPPSFHCLLALEMSLLIF